MIATRLHNNVWRQIFDLISRSQSRSEITYGKVTGQDVKNNNIFVQGFGDRPIPIIGFRYTVEYWDTQTIGATPAVGAPLPSRAVKRKVTVEPDLPKVGDTVMVLRHLGADRLPKCVGVLLSTNFVRFD
jgi:hypothetical protein